MRMSAGVDERTLPSTEVTVHGKEDLWGVIGIKPNYLLEQGKTAKLKELAVDTGLSAEKVKEIVAVGDSITPCTVCRQTRQKAIQR